MAYDYALSYPVIQAPAAARAAFIRRTYSHLAGAILAFVGLEALLMSIPGLKEDVARVLFSGGSLGWLVVLGAFMLTGMLAQKWATSDSSRGLQYLGLGLYVVVEAVIFMPLLWVASVMADPNVIPAAGIAALAVFGGLTIAVFITGRDFSFLRTALSVGSLLAFGFIIASAFLPITLGLVFSYAMVALMSGYILYYTSNVLYHYRTDQHVAAALALFACVATLFWYILQIFMSRR
jgi:FtsH-binding integral membrane protein